MEGRRAHAVAHLAYARSQKSGTGILGSKRVLQGGEKSSPLVVLCDLWLVYGVYGLGGEKMWSGERNYGLGSSAAGGKYGPGREIMVLGHPRPRPSVVQGAKLRPWVKPVPAKVWSREPNCGPGSPPAPPKYGLGSKTVPPGQASPRPSVVQGEKLRPRVKPVPARVWSRERNRGPGSPPAPPECGPGSQTAALGQARPCRSMV